jgi:hypothetical protein
MPAPDKTPRRVTLTLPACLIQYADCKAAELGVSRSQVVADVLSRACTCERNDLAAEGYRFYARDAEEFAADCLCACSQALEEQP